MQLSHSGNSQHSIHFLSFFVVLFPLILASHCVSFRVAPPPSSGGGQEPPSRAMGDAEADRQSQASTPLAQDAVQPDVTTGRGAVGVAHTGC